MASIKKKSSGGGGANWMDTYGDMVTLLRCFFVLLYSMSTIDSEKWMMIVQSFNKNAVVSDDQPPGPDGTESSTGGMNLPLTQDMQAAMDELYEYLALYAQNSEEGSVSVSKGSGWVFISFDDTVFFDGDSYRLRAEGQRILDDIIPALNTAAPHIDELRVLGHTAQRVADSPNPPEGDWRLSTNRADSVIIYLYNNMDLARLDPGRLVAQGHGQWRPVSPNDNEQTRSKNRRVELMITGLDPEDELGDSMANYSTMYTTATGKSGES